ncbi:uncharacterized protein LOC129293932 [Prosopis cineraria]|uniref:uncharacterized protein LOC129293932 n=1 Tax=Prosopis cineraria TaxID=364024 RepID=UPI0024103181|nr:uncharacterized protein LOC129293932 [Prosopis cineraria]
MTHSLTSTAIFVNLITSFILGLLPLLSSSSLCSLLQLFSSETNKRRVFPVQISMSVTPIVFLFSFFFFVLTCIFQSSYASTFLVDGASLWKNPLVYIEDSVVFKHKQNYKLYIFQSQRAFNLCNLSQATLLTKPNATSYTWHPWRTGFFYFTFNDGSLRACQASQKLAIKVSNSAPPPEESAMSPDISPTEAPAPAPSSGADGSPSSTFPWPFQPASPVPSTTGKGGSGMPFINSNPAVPLPTGEVDSATIRPTPTSADQRPVMIEILPFHIAFHSMAFLLPLLL